ncbi:MAG: MFS transporter [Ruminococcaceae bacterium]|nr:MFS transporter [Oscillospiraceae bacterium]
MNLNIKNKKRLDYKWVVAGLCFLMMFVGLGFCSTAKNAYFQPIVEALNFSRGAFGLSDTFRYATTSIVTLFFYKLVERFGTKKIVCAGLVCYTLFTLTNAISNTLIGFYIGGIFLGLAVAFAGSTMVSVIVNKWFTKNKGTVLGIILAANAGGSALAVALLEPMIYSGGVGYKNAYFVTSVAVVSVFLIVALFYKDKVCDVVLDHSKEKKQESAEWEGFSYEILARKPAFYAVIICIAMYALSSVGSIATPHFKDIGFSGEFIALTVCIGSIVLMVSKILMGIIYDRFGIKVSVNICLFTSLAAKLILFFVTSQTPILAITYTVLMSVATPLETVMIPIIVLDLFGQRSFHKSLAITTSLFTVGHALNAPLVNIPYDFSNNYLISFVTSTVASAMIIVILNCSMRSLKRAQKENLLR